MRGWTERPRLGFKDKDRTAVLPRGKARVSFGDAVGPRVPGAGGLGRGLPGSRAERRAGRRTLR